MMMRRFLTLAVALVALLFLTGLPALAQEDTGLEAGEETAKEKPKKAKKAKKEKKERPEGERLGMFIRLTLNDLQLQNSGLLLAAVDDPAEPLAGKVIESSWNSRLTPEFLLGFMLPGDRGTLQFRWFQFDETLDIGQHGGPFRNLWASPMAGFDEDLDGDGDVDGFDCGSGGVPGDPDQGCEDDGDQDIGDLKDGAEDYGGRAGLPDFIAFSHSNSLVAKHSAEVLHLDLEYVRKIKEGMRFHLDGSVGLRFARVNQSLELSYRELGAFAAYIDDPNDSFRSTNSCPNEPIDADGDGNNPSGDRTGDGWGNGNGPRVNQGTSCGAGQDSRVGDDLIHIPIQNEDRINASISSEGFGIVAGLRSEYWFAREPRKTTPGGFKRKWSLESGLRVGIVWGDSDAAYQETFIRERDALPNFINWDFNQDGYFGRNPESGAHDFDFNGDGRVTQEDWADDQISKIPLAGAKLGILDSICGGIACPDGTPADPYADGEINEGDPIPESERNTNIVRTTTTVRDMRASTSQMFTSVEVDVGLRYRFSRFADISFGARATRWFDVGNLRPLTSGETAEALTNGDISLHGFFVTLTVWPKF
jgi:hypothetical protein